MNKWKLSHYFQLFSLIVLGACTTEHELPLPADGSLSFQVKESYVENERSRNLETPIQGVSSVVLSIESADGSQTLFDRKSLPILGFGEEILIEEILLSPGNFQLSEFYLTDSSGNILYATPMEGSEYGDYLAEPLPIPFEVTTNGSQNLALEIISTAAKKPEPFGFESGLAGFRETFYFFISAVREKVDDYMMFLPAELRISKGSYSQVYNLKGKLNRIVLPKETGIYEISAEYESYLPFQKSYSSDSLSQFGITPLVVELIKDPYIGGQFSGNLSLSTQSQVDSIAKAGYTSINGKLTIRQAAPEIDDPITSLSGLETIKHIFGDLVIENNPLLQDLNGLQSIGGITGELILKNNLKLESCSHISGISELNALSLIGNPSLSSFDAFHSIAPLVTVLNVEQMEHFESLQDLGEFSKVSRINIIGNPRLRQLNFNLPIPASISYLGIADNPLLEKFGGTEGGTFDEIGSLFIRNNAILEDLSGLLTEEGKVGSTFSLVGNPKLKSFEPISFESFLTGIEIHDNESLLNLNPLLDVYSLFDYISIVNNSSITSLDGIKSLGSIHFDRNPYVPTPEFVIRIRDNKLLTDFCGVSRLILQFERKYVQISGNSFNPSNGELVEGACKK